MTGSWRPIPDDEFQKLLNEQIFELSTDELDVFRRFSVRIQTGSLRRSEMYGDDKVNIVLRCSDHVLYYDDVEDGFNFSLANEKNSILTPYCNQDRLSEAIRWHVIPWLKSV